MSAIIGISVRLGRNAQKAGKGCVYRGVRLREVEAALTENPQALLAEMPHSDSTLGDDIASHEAQLGVLDDHMERLLDELQRGHSEAIANRLRDLEGNRDAVKVELEALLRRAEQEEARLVQLKARNLLGALKAAPFDRQVANAALRQCLERVVVDYRSGFLELHWAHGGASSLLYAFPRQSRAYAPRSEATSGERA